MNKATDDPAPSLHSHRAQQELHRYYEPVRRPTPDRYSVPHGSAARDAPSHLTIEAVPGQAFSRSMQKQQIRLTSPPCRTPPSQSADPRWAHPGALHRDPGFDVTFPSNDTFNSDPGNKPPGLRTVFLIPT